MNPKKPGHGPKNFQGFWSHPERLGGHHHRVGNVRRRLDEASDDGVAVVTGGVGEDLSASISAQVVEQLRVDEPCDLASEEGIAEVQD